MVYVSLFLVSSRGRGDGVEEHWKNDFNLLEMSISASS